METTELSYPVFEANQVLSASHLNDMVEYLDEQSRLTRADLIGIGIVCGLEVRFDAPGIVTISRGCGVTSEGYLIIEPNDVALKYASAYRLPKDSVYSPFMRGAPRQDEQITLWELFTHDNEDENVELAKGEIDLKDKAVVLFLELRHDRSELCGPADCDDRGGAMTATVRRLLVDVADLARLNDALKERVPATFGGDLEARLGLPDLRMPRFDVDNSSPVTAQNVLSAFHFAFRRSGFVRIVAEALTALYRAFRPLVGEEFPQNPFEQFRGRFGFLDGADLTRGQVVFLQYYWDLFDDILAAYDEVRREGVRLVGACCPPADLFPRHLTLGVLRPDRHAPARYRHRFVPSPAVGDSVSRARDVRTLFRRLVTMIRDFVEGAPDKGVRITPSRSGGPLSQKAIPYYYVPKGTPALCDVWDPVKAERGRGNLNLGYRSDQYTPPTPAFVTEPLRFDLEPNDFLRIEGHLGRNVESVLEAMLTERKKMRLPFEVIALRTGAFNDRFGFDLSKEDCRFEDLDTLYATLAAEMRCFLVKQVQYFYELPVTRDDDDGDDDTSAIKPSLPILRDLAPAFRVARQTVGSRIEELITWKPGLKPPKIGAIAQTLDLENQAVRLVSAISSLAEAIKDDVRSLDFDVLRTRYAAIVLIGKRMEGARRDEVISAVALEGRLEDIIYRCRLEPFEALEKEYRRRILKVKEAQFLSHFLERHPGIQHKAGVPLGGTFILVYHEDPPIKGPLKTGQDPKLILTNVPIWIADLGTPTVVDVDAPADVTDASVMAMPLNVAGSAAAVVEPEIVNADLVIQNQTINLAGSDFIAAGMAKLIREAKGADLAAAFVVSKVLRDAGLIAGPGTAGDDRAFDEVVGAMADGTVIADFFLPYSCHSDCTPIQYQLPSVRLRATLAKSCTSADRTAAVKLAVEGASGAISVSIDDGAFEETDGSLLLTVGDHTVVVRDSSGNESSPVEIDIPPQLVITDTDVSPDDANATFRATAIVQGGKPPYSVDPRIGSIVEGTFTSVPFAVGETLELTLTDAAGCRVETTIRSEEDPCDLPCAGEAIREGHRFWLPEPKRLVPWTEVTIEVQRFVLRSPTAEYEIHKQVTGFAAASISSTEFASKVAGWLEQIRRAVEREVGSDELFGASYLPPRTGGDATGVLQIERLDCIDYHIEVVVSYKVGGGDSAEKRAVALTYNPDGTGYFDDNPDAPVQFRTPPSDRAVSNKCAGSQWIERCEDAGLELAFTFTVLGDGPQVEFAADPPPDDPLVLLVWEVQEAFPPISLGPSTVVTFAPFEAERLKPIEKRVRLTAYTDTGCTVTVDEVIDLAKREGRSR